MTPAASSSFALLLVSACACAPSTASSSMAAKSAPSALREIAGAPARVASNVLRADYAGSASCQPCHAGLFSRWQSSPMHEMTRDAAALRGPFDGAVFSFKGDTATTFTSADRHYMRVQSQRAGEHLYVVTEVIGGRVREDYAGVEVAHVGDDVVGDAKILPASYLLLADRWRYKGYSVMVSERPGLAAGPVWRTTCIFCHNETPYITEIYNALESPRKTVYQGSVSDNFLPEGKRTALVVDDAPGLLAAVNSERARLAAGIRASPSTSLAQAASLAAAATERSFGARDLVEIGIGCEMCHNGSRAHVAANGAVATSFLPVSPLFHIDGAGSEAQRINRTCARCHTVLFSQYQYTWEGGRRDAKNPALAGGSSINSGEGRDFLLGGCATRMSCVTCHDPHEADGRAKLDAMGGVAGNAICVSCHVGHDDVAHTHHVAGGAGSACLSCHMPKKNAGLDGKLTRYHRIGSPTDAVRVTEDRPLECALCHADKSVRAIVDDMERLWGKRYDRVKLASLYGDLEQNALLATLRQGKPHEQIVAAAVLGERGTADALPALIAALPHRLPIARPYLKGAIEALAREPMNVDVDLDASALAAAADAWWKEWKEKRERAR